MRIAIVGPSPVPFVRGGLENFLFGLVQAFNKYTVHQAELIKLPSRELSFWELIDTYHRFYELDLNHFDLVISTKYPSWMISHRNHICYMTHKLRGLYDTYNGEKELVGENYKIKRILEIANSPVYTDERLLTLFDLLNDLKDHLDAEAQRLLIFPGPLIRKIIHFMDNVGLSPNRIKGYFCISNRVKNREDYFPRGVHVEVVHPPSSLPYFKRGNYDYIFVAGRLDAPKRVELIVKAMRYVPHDIKLKITGMGPQEDFLKNLANGDSRIEFLEPVGYDELIDLHSNALVVPFVPFDEDFGLVALEAMMSKKPVVTAYDSGGVCELVTNGETGFVTNADPKSIARCLNYLIEHRDEAMKMGDRAYQSVKHITWENVVRQLLPEAPKSELSFGTGFHRKHKVLVLSTFPIYPPRFGGQIRVYNLCRGLAKDFEVTALSLVEFGKLKSEALLSKGLRVICMPQSEEHAKRQWELEKATGLSLFDVASVANIFLSTEYVEKFKELSSLSDIIVCEHPYLFDLIKDFPEKTIVYDAANVEYVLKDSYFKSSSRYGELIDIVRNIEARACKDSDIVLTTSDDDRGLLSELYRVAKDKIFVVPNGIDAESARFLSEEERKKVKESLGLSKHHTILFSGSWHHPNLEAMNFIVNQLASRNKAWAFMILGEVGDYFFHQHPMAKLPCNTLAFGYVSDEEKAELYGSADVAINPMSSGSGTNIKMLDYMAAGIPVVSTPTGARGLEVKNGEHIVMCDLKHFRQEITRLLVDSSLRERLRQNARDLVLRNYDWEVITPILSRILSGTEVRT